MTYSHSHTTASHRPQTCVAAVDTRWPRWQSAAFGLLLVTAASLSAVGVLAGLSHAPPRAGIAAQTGAPMPGADEAPAAVAAAHAAVLARSTLLALDAANRTGNYMRLHDAAAPPFQARNTPDDLARIFAGQRNAGLDLKVAANEAPRWDEAPALGDDGQLRMRGHYEIPGHILRFALQFAPVLREWRLMEISIAAEPRPGP